MDMNSEALGRLVNCTPVHKTKTFVLTSVTDPATGKPAELQVRAGMIVEIVTLLQRFPQLKFLFNPTADISRMDAFVMAGAPAISALIAQNLGKFRDAKFEAWVSKWSEDDMFEFIGCFVDMTMPEGLKSFFARVVRYLQRLGLPADLADLVISRMDEIAAKLSAMRTKLAESPQSTLSIKGLLKMIAEDEEDEEPNMTAASPITSPSSSPEAAPNSKSEGAEPTLGL